MRDASSHQIPMQTRLAAIGSVNVEARTAELVWSTGAQVKRWDFWTGKRLIEELSLDPKHVDLARLNNGAPLLNAHNSYGLSGVIGVVEPGTATVDGKQARAQVRFSKREEVEAIFRDVQDKIIRNVSVGYSVHKYQVTERENELPIYRAVSWEPMELSLVPVGADSGAGVRQQDTRSFECEFVRADQAVNFQEAAAAAEIQEEPKMQREEGNTNEERGTAAEVRLQERTRIADIRAIARVGKMPDAWAQRYIDDGTPVDEVRSAYFQQKVDEYDATATRGPAACITLGLDPRDSRDELYADALAARCGSPLKNPAARQYMGLRVTDIARDYCERAGKRTTHLSNSGVIDMALSLRAGLHSTSDFSNLLLGTGDRVLRQAYSSYDGGLKQICRPSTARDFRAKMKLQLGEAPTLIKVNEHGEFKHGSMAEAVESYSLITYGRIVGLTRQALVNDDLGAFGDLASRFGRSARELEAQILVDLLTSNPVLSDGVALFHATHANLAAVASVISIASLGDARKALRLQKGLSLVPIDVTPRFLIVPAALETVAEQFLTDLSAAQSSNVNPFGNGKLELIVEPRLDAVSATAWYVAADPGTIDTIEFAHLEGAEGPQTMVREGFDVDGMEMKCRLDFGAGIMDFRGLYKNSGV